MDIKIESNVPLLRRHRSHKRPGRTPKYSLPLMDMKPGDSIFVPISMYSDKFEEKVNKGKDYATHYVTNTIKSHVKRFKLKSKFTTRQIHGDNGKVIGARVWRVS
jgi:hypothetical protein